MFEAFLLFNIDMSVAYKQATGIDKKIPDDLWFLQARRRRGDPVDNPDASKIPADQEIAIRKRRVEILTDLYALLEPVFESPFPMECDDE